MSLTIKHLLGLEGVPRDDISLILDTAVINIRKYSGYGLEMVC